MNIVKSENEFKMLSMLFLEKWNKNEPEFSKYFESTWLGSHCDWFEAAAIHSPSHNKGLEGDFHSLQIFHLTLYYFSFQYF